MDEALGMNVKIKFAQGGILCMTLHNDPDPPDFEAIYRDWDAYDAQQQEAGQAPGLVPAGRHHGV